MESLKLGGNNGYVQIKLTEVYGFPANTSFMGGYDAKGIVEIKSSNYSVCGELWFSTGEIYKFYTILNECYQKLNGKVELLTTEANLNMAVNFEKMGHVRVCGQYKERHDEDNKLIFEIFSDQSYIKETLISLNNFVKKYGGLQGVKDNLGNRG